MNRCQGELLAWWGMPLTEIKNHPQSLRKFYQRCQYPPQAWLWREASAVAPTVIACEPLSRGGYRRAMKPLRHTGAGPVLRYGDAPVALALGGKLLLGRARPARAATYPAGGSNDDRAQASTWTGGWRRRLLASDGKRCGNRVIGAKSLSKVNALAFTRPASLGLRE